MVEMAGILDNPGGNAPVLQMDAGQGILGAMQPGPGPMAKPGNPDTPQQGDVIGLSPCIADNIPSITGRRIRAGSQPEHIRPALSASVAMLFSANEPTAGD